jgi:lysophospholipase L1-like esterase
MRRLVRFAWILAANALLTALLLEIALRVQQPFLHLMSRGYHDSPNYHFAFIDHPIWDHQLRPGLAGYEIEVRPPVAAEGLRYVLRTNSWGCRYGEIAVPRPESTFRVIVLGDSFTEGLREEETSSQYLERSLDALGLPLDFEVMNCGASSYSLLPILLRLREQLLAAEPDAVIVNIDLTDLHDDYFRRRPDLRIDAAGEPVAVGDPRAHASALRDFLEFHSYAARGLAAWARLFDRAVRHRSRDASAAEPRKPDGKGELFTLSEKYRLHTRDPEAAADFERAWQFFSVQLDRIVALCDAKGIPCAFSTYPHQAQLPVGDAAPALHREFAKRIAAQLAARGVFFYDAYDDIARAYAGDHFLYFTGDMHFRPAGQRAWGKAYAQAFTPWVQELSARRPARTAGRRR